MFRSGDVWGPSMTTPRLGLKRKKRLGFAWLNSWHLQCLHKTLCLVFRLWLWLHERRGICRLGTNIKWDQNHRTLHCCLSRTENNPPDNEWLDMSSANGADNTRSCFLREKIMNATGNSVWHKQQPIIRENQD